MLCETGTSTIFCKLKNIRSKDVDITAKSKTVHEILHFTTIVMVTIPVLGPEILA